MLNGSVLFVRRCAMLTWNFTSLLVRDGACAVYRCAGDEIIVFVEREVRTIVKFAAQTVGVDLFLSKVNNLCVGSNG